MANSNQNLGGIKKCFVLTAEKKMSMAHTSVNSVDHLWSQLLNLAAQPQPTPVPPAAPQQSAQTVSQPQCQQANAANDPMYVSIVSPEYVVEEKDKTLRLINFIFCIISLVATCWAVIPLAWMIPMTVHSWGIYKGTKPNTTGFGVCTLIFVTLVGGILLLCSKKDK